MYVRVTLLSWRIIILMLPTVSLLDRLMRYYISFEYKQFKGVSAYYRYREQFFSMIQGSDKYFQSSPGIPVTYVQRN